MLKHKNILTLTYKFTNTQTTPPFIFLTLNEQQNFLNLFLQKKKQKVFKEIKNCIKKERTRMKKNLQKGAYCLFVSLTKRQWQQFVDFSVTEILVCQIWLGKKRKYMTTH